MPSTCSEYQWILMERDFFGFDKDLYVCFAYITPLYSSFYIDQDIAFVEMVESDISKYKSYRKAMNRNWSNQKANPTLKTKTGNK